MGCFWTDLAQVTQECDNTPAPGVLNLATYIVPYGDPAPPCLVIPADPTYADVFGDASAYVITAAGAIGPSHPALALAIPCCSIDRGDPGCLADVCGSCSLDFSQTSTFTVARADGAPLTLDDLSPSTPFTEAFDISWQLQNGSGTVLPIDGEATMARTADRGLHTDGTGYLTITHVGGLPLFAAGTLTVTLATNNTTVSGAELLVTAFSQTVELRCLC